MASIGTDAGVGAAAGSVIPGIGTALGGVAGAGIGLLGNLLQQGGQQASITQQEDYQTQMSNTAYQRATADMTKAGLNPALMYGSGGPESTPSGASMTPPNLTSGVMSSAMDVANGLKQMQVSDSVIANNLASAYKTTKQGDISGVEAGLANTGQALLSGLESFIQGWGKTNANSNGVSGLFHQLNTGAQQMHAAPGGGDSYTQNPNPVDNIDSDIDKGISTFFQGMH